MKSRCIYTVRVHVSLKDFWAGVPAGFCFRVVLGVIRLWKLEIETDGLFTKV